MTLRYYRTLEGLSRVEDELIGAVAHNGTYCSGQYKEEEGGLDEKDPPNPFRSRYVAK